MEGHGEVPSREMTFCENIREVLMDQGRIQSERLAPGVRETAGGGGISVRVRCIRRELSS